MFQSQKIGGSRWSAAFYDDGDQAFLNLRYAPQKSFPILEEYNWDLP